VSDTRAAIAVGTRVALRLDLQVRPDTCGDYLGPATVVDTMYVESNGLTIMRVRFDRTNREIGWLCFHDPLHPSDWVLLPDDYIEQFGPPRPETA